MKELKFESEGALCDYLEYTFHDGECPGDKCCDDCYAKLFRELGVEVVIKVPEEIEVTQNYTLLKNGKMITWIYKSTKGGPAPQSLIDSWNELGMGSGEGVTYSRVYKVKEDEVTLDVAWEMK